PARPPPPASTFSKPLETFYLKDYLAKPSAALGKKACFDKVGKTFKGPVTGGDRWEKGALDFWNKQPIPDFARKIRPKLPAELAAATDILSVKNRVSLA